MNPSGTSFRNCSRKASLVEGHLLGRRSIPGRRHDISVDQLPQLIGVGVSKRPQLAGTDVPPVAEHAHQLVIPEQRQHTPAGARRVALQAAQQIQDPARVVAAIEDVTGLNQDRPAPGPAIARIEQAGGAQDGDEAVVGAVDVAHGHHPLGGGDVANLGCLGLSV